MGIQITDFDVSEIPAQVLKVPCPIGQLKR